MIKIHIKRIQQKEKNSLQSSFLDATKHLYKRFCPSVGLSVCRSVRPLVPPSFGLSVRPSIRLLVCTVYHGQKYSNLSKKRNFCHKPSFFTHFLILQLFETNFFGFLAFFYIDFTCFHQILFEILTNESFSSIFLVCNNNRIGNPPF